MKNLQLSGEIAPKVIEIEYCEICPGRARFEVTFRTGVLYFCGYHFTSKKQHLEKVSLAITQINQTQPIE
jgi:hypothetical protein